MKIKGVKNSRWILIRVSLALICALIFEDVFIASDVAGPANVHAAKSTQQQMNDKKNEINDIKGDIKDINNDINKYNKRKKQLKAELDQLDADLTEVCEHLADLENKIAVKIEEITAAEIALEEAIAVRDKQYEDMVIRTRNMCEKNDVSILNAILNAGSLKNVLSIADYYAKIQEYDKEQLALYKQNCIDIENMKDDLNAQKKELEGLKREAEAEQERVNQLIDETSAKIADYADLIEEAEAEALKKEAELKKAQEDYDALVKQYEEELRLAALAAKAVWRDISEVTFAEGDRKLLANLIYCEAGGEPYAGKLAVGAVVINRVLSSRYPDTVTGVIRQKSQFSPVGSGRLDLYLSIDKAASWPDCYKAADEAMSGATNVATCLYFRTPIPGITPKYTIGGHIFY